MSDLRHQFTGLGFLNFTRGICYDPVTLAALSATASAAAPYMMMGGTILSAAGAVQQGKAANESAKFTAKQLEASALTEKASSQREANEQRKNAALVQSRARAVGAASGGGLDFELMGDIAEEGEYRALTAMWEGDERAAGRTMQAQASRFEGKQAKKAGVVKAGSTLLSGGAQSLQMKYG